jgi:cell division initiation protein
MLKLEDSTNSISPRTVAPQAVVAAAPQAVVAVAPQAAAPLASQAPAPLAPPAADTRRLPSPERHVSVTPIDMRQARFASSMRGFDKSEVTSFLEEAASDYDYALRENERLRQHIATLEVSLTQYRELEGSLKSTLISAQKVADDMRENGQKEATRLVTEAQGRAELMMQKAQARVDDAGREIETLKLKRREAQTSIEACVSSLQSTLDFVREQDQRDREQRVVPHRAPVEITRQTA